MTTWQDRFSATRAWARALIVVTLFATFSPAAFAGAVPIQYIDSSGTYSGSGNLQGTKFSGQLSVREITLYFDGDIVGEFDCGNRVRRQRRDVERYRKLCDRLRYNTNAGLQWKSALWGHSCIGIA